MFTSKKELEAIQKRADQKAEEIARKGQDMTNEDLLDLCTLNKLRNKASQLLDEEEG